MQFLKDQSLIRFDEKNHKYFTKDGKELLSVTRFIELFKEGFDPTGSILTSCAIKRGISEEELQQEWTDKKNIAADFGTKFHADIESYLKTGHIKRTENADLIRYFKKNYPAKGKYYSEVVLFDEEFSICGTTDILDVHSDVVDCQDFKTNAKRLDNYSYGKKFYEPISFLDAGKLNGYVIQISIYSYILIKKYDLWPGKDHCIYWINRKKRIIEKIPITLMLQSIESMLDWYKRGLIK